MVEYGIVVPEYNYTVKVYCFEDECEELSAVLENYGLWKLCFRVENSFIETSHILRRLHFWLNAY